MAHARPRPSLAALALALALVVALAFPSQVRAEEPTEPPAPLPAIAQPKPTFAWHMPIKGETLTVRVGATTPTKVRATYEWLRNGAPIAGATARTYTLKAADVGHKITARVTVAAAGYETSVQTSAKTATIKARPSLSKSNSLWLVVNKKRPLKPARYVPRKLVKVTKVPGGSSKRLRPEAAAALRKLSAAARKAGAGFTITSGYRSYATQRSLFNTYVKRYGRTSAERFSARPGYSEHQTGLTVDLRYTSKCHLKKCAGATKSGKWVAKNAYKYGFIVRYPQAKEKVTGYKYEPWHLRYVGVELATAMHRAKITTLEEYFKLPKAPKY